MQPDNFRLRNSDVARIDFFGDVISCLYIITVSSSKTSAAADETFYDSVKGNGDKTLRNLTASYVSCELQLSRLKTCGPSSFQ